MEPVEWTELIKPNPIIVDGGSQGESGFYDEVLESDASILQFNGKPLLGSAGSDKTGEYVQSTASNTYGFDLISLQGSLGTFGYADREGYWQAKYQLECVHGGINAGVSTKFIGARVYGTCVTVSGKVRAYELFGQKIYVGLNLDLISAGVKAGYNPQTKKAEFGASLGVGASISISFEDIEETGYISGRILDAVECVD